MTVSKLKYSKTSSNIYSKTSSNIFEHVIEYLFDTVIEYQFRYSHRIYSMMSSNISISMMSSKYSNMSSNIFDDVIEIFDDMFNISMTYSNISMTSSKYSMTCSNISMTSSNIFDDSSKVLIHTARHISEPLLVTRHVSLFLKTALSKVMILMNYLINFTACFSIFSFKFRVTMQLIRLVRDS